MFSTDSGVKDWAGMGFYRMGVHELVCRMGADASMPILLGLRRYVRVHVLFRVAMECLIGTSWCSEASKRNTDRHACSLYVSLLTVSYPSRHRFHEYTQQQCGLSTVFEAARSRKHYIQYWCSLIGMRYYPTPPPALPLAPCPAKLLRRFSSSAWRRRTSP